MIRVWIAFVLTFVFCAQSAYAASFALKPADVSGSESDAENVDASRRHGIFQRWNAQGFVVTSFGSADSLDYADFATDVVLAFPSPMENGVFLLTPKLQVDSFYDCPDWNLKFDSTLYRIGLNLAFLYNLNERWSFYTFFNPTFSSDFQNCSGDAYRFPGGLTASFQQTSALKWTFGVVYPAVEGWPLIPFAGLTWIPSENWKVELMFPRSKVSTRLNSPLSPRPLWVYAAGEFLANTWAVRLEDDYNLSSGNDLMTYRDFRLAVGIQNDTPRIGTLNYSAELGVTFGRKLRFEDAPEKLYPDPGLVARVQLSF